MDATQYQHFFFVIFHINKKTLPSSIHLAKFSKSTKFYKNLLQIHTNMGPQTYQKMYAKGQALSYCFVSL